MTKQFDKEMAEVNALLLKMAALVEEMIESAINSLFERSKDSALEVYNKEGKVNALQVQIDEKCINILALQQPAAIDLRMIMSVMKINSDLERMGDQAINIAGSSLELLKDKPVIIISDLKKMGISIKLMVRQSIESFITSDLEKAKMVLLEEKEVDLIKGKILQELLKVMADSPWLIKPSLVFILVSRNLERIADHTTNIAEDVIFIVTGRDIRHHIQDINK